ncbi:MAG: DUF3750 domain-containing protein [Betaproteobacteria bacterium]
MAFLLFVGLLFFALAVGRGVIAQDWRTASTAPTGLAPDPATTPEAVVQVYGARTWGWRGNFGVHTWVAVKPANASAYTVYEVIGWRLRWSDTVVAIHNRAADARWYGNAPELYADKRGPEAEKLIPRVDAAARSYPHATEYSAWPGPNSNTFVAWITRAVPELEADLPPTAIGKDYISGSIVGSAPSGSGVQFSLAGLFALTASGVEGLEVNLLGLTFGINPFDPALKLPLLGRLGPARSGLPVSAD